MKNLRLPGNPCAYLFFAILLLLVTLPLLIGTESGRVVANVINLAILLTAVAAVGRSRRSLVIAALVGLPVVGFQVLAFVQGDALYLIWSWVFGSGFYCVALVLLLHYVLLPQVMNSDKLYGAAAAYVMLGIMWSYWYGIIQHFYPGPFSPAGAPLSLFDLLYFSFAVLTTAGFGDIVPVAAVARGLTVLEQLAGVIYIAILIARLHSMYSTDEGVQ